MGHSPRPSEHESSPITTRPEKTENKRKKAGIGPFKKIMLI